MFAKLTAAAALVAAAMSASAMTTVSDDELSAVSGQDGVSIVANLNINLGSFTYVDGNAADAAAANVGFNNITVKGLMAMTIDVLTDAQFGGAAVAAIMANGVTDVAAAATLAGAVGVATGHVAGSDVVQFAFPNIGTADAHTVTPTITVGSIAGGHGGASFGGMILKNLDLQGTQVWMYGH